jgi:LacI family gluconate utilization system Gnt-I transcriptional repressor
MTVKCHPSRNNGGRTHLRQTTIKEVAKMAGVSLMTVSRVINSPERVSSKTYEVVHEVIKRTNYIHNRLASGLSRSRTDQVAVLVPSLSNLVFSDLLNGMASLLEPKEIQMMVGNYHYIQRKLEDQIRLFLEWSPDAMVIVGPVPEAVTPLLRRSGIPVVETVEIVDPPFDCSVGISHEAAGYAMAQYLTDLGYRRMATISANAGLERRTAQRISGFSRYLAENCFPRAQPMELENRSSIAEGKIAMRHILGAARHPEAVFCANDDLAFGAMMACVEAGLDIPEDMGIAGFNALDIALQCIPSITTIKVDRFHIGELSAQILLKRLSGENDKNKVCLNVGFTIIPGVSTHSKHKSSAADSVAEHAENFPKNASKRPKEIPGKL